MKNIISLVLVALLFAGCGRPVVNEPVDTYNVQPAEVKQLPAPGERDLVLPPKDKLQTMEAPAFSSGNESTGIKLPANAEYSTKEQFVDVRADCPGLVKWLVITTAPDNVKNPERVKFVDRGSNLISVGVPQHPVVISIYAVGTVNGKLTDFVRTDLTIVDNGSVRPPPDTVDPVTPPPGPIYVTIIDDPNNRTPELAAILNSPTIATALPATTYRLLLLSRNSSAVASKGFDKAITTATAQHGQQPAWLIVQDKSGRVLLGGAVPVPKTEDELVKLVKSAR